MRKGAAAIGGVVALVAGAWIARPALGVDAGLTVTRTPPRTVVGTTDYDGATRTLTLACETRSDMACVFLVDADGRRRLRVAPGAQVRLASIADDGRSCVLAEGDPASRCAWSPLSAPPG